MPLTGYAPNGNALASSRYDGMTAYDLAAELARTGYTQEGVDRLYELRGLGTAPRLPAGMEGLRQLPTRGARLFQDASGRRVQGTTEFANFLNNFNTQAVDPYRQQSGISQVAGGVLNLVGSAVGGPVWTALTGTADAGNNALGNNDGTSYTDGRRSTIDQVGSAIGSIYSSVGGPGSYGARNNLPGAIDESGATGSGGGNAMGWDWGQILDYAAPIVGGLLERDGAKDAARTAAAGNDAAIAETRRQYDQTRADQMPWLQAGTEALGRLNDPNAFTASPGYAFQREEGTRDIGNSFSARGGAQSGNALRRLAEFNSGLAAQDYGNWWNRQAGIAGVGQTAATNLGSLGANASTNIGNALVGGANARASGIEGSTNALTGTVADLWSTYNRNRKPQYAWGG